MTHADKGSIGRPRGRAVAASWLPADSEMGRRVAEFDWASTPLGPISTWPAELRAAAALCLASQFPMSVRWGPEQTFLYNDACREVYGEARYADALGRSTAEVWPEVAAQVEDRLATVIAQRRPYLAVDQLVPIDRAVPGEECYFTFCYAPIATADGAVGGVHSVFMETTRQVLAERRLRVLAGLGRRLPVAGSEQEVADLALRLLAHNASDHVLGRLYRVGAGEPRLLASYGEEPGAERVAKLIEGCLRNHRSEHERNARDGRLHAFPLLGTDGGEPSHVLVLAHSPSRPWDNSLVAYSSLAANTIATAMLTQEEIRGERQRTARAEALDAAKSAFFAGISHELRTPLALIAAPVQAVLDEAELDPTSRRNLRLVADNAERLTRMVDAMLDFSRIEAGRVAPKLVEADPGTILAGLAASFAPAMRRAGLEFVVDLPKVELAASVDRDFLERIVSNLLTNALKYTPAGSVVLTLTATADTYTITVKDTGLGIRPEDRQRIFSRFERIEAGPGARAASGVGIGLAMVRELTDLLGGDVRLESEVGTGSTFAVDLPLRPRVRSRLSDGSITPRRPESFLAEVETWLDPAGDGVAADTTDPRLLIIEDDPQLARFLADSLRGEYRVDLAPNGLAGLQLLRRDRPDLVLTDITMPELDGLGVLEEIRRDPGLADLPVVVLSSNASAEASVAGLDTGADDYIAKPFSLVDLRARLAANLNRSRARSVEVAWRQAIIRAMRDSVLIFDGDGEVLELNQAFTDLLGYSLADGPIRPPYPWWPTEAEDAAALADIRAAHASIRQGLAVEGDFRFFRRDRRPVWVRSTGAVVRHDASGVKHLRTFRDITKDREAQQRRAAAAEVSQELATTDDLADLIGVAQHGFAVLFDGETTIRLGRGSREVLFGSSGTVSAADLPPGVAAGLAGERSADTVRPRPGILLVPPAPDADYRAWVQFPTPRPISLEELIAADLLAAAFGSALGRVSTAERAANLEYAVESHRLIGQATGILVERHKLTPMAAFDLIKQASQRRNLKLREIAQRVIETGAEPDEA